MSRYDAMSERVRKMEAQLDAALGRTEDSCLALLDELGSCGPDIDEVDKAGLKDAAKALRKRARTAAAGPPA